MSAPNPDAVVAAIRKALWRTDAYVLPDGGDESGWEVVDIGHGHVTVRHLHGVEVHYPFTLARPDPDENGARKEP